MNVEVNKRPHPMTLRSGELIVRGTPAGVSPIAVETQSQANRGSVRSRRSYLGGLPEPAWARPPLALLRPRAIRG